MKFRRQIGVGLCFLGFLPAISAQQSNSQLVASTENHPISIRVVRAVSQPDGPTIEVISDGSLVPSIRKLENPARLVIDLPNARLTANQKRLEYHSSEVRDVRLNQFRENPAIVRVVVDLAQPITYTWDAAGNLLTVRMRATQPSASVPTVPALTKGVQPAVVPVTPVSQGAVLLAGSRVPAGSSVSAGSDTAILRLGRGGEIRVCPQTTVSVTSSQNGHSLMLGMSTGALEAHYALDASSDSILTPDFRILLAGPGEFHYGIRANSHGDTCIQALPGNTASLIVSELLGDGTYQVKPNQEISFRAGRINAADTAINESCGCPPPSPALLRASSTPPVSTTQSAPATLPMNQTHSGGSTTQVSNALPVLPSPETAPAPASKPNDVHVQVDVPFVFNANQPAPAPGPSWSAPPIAPTREAALLPIRDTSQAPRLQTTVLPPPAKAHHGVFGSIRNFFSKIFG